MPLTRLAIGFYFENIGCGTVLNRLHSDGWNGVGNSTNGGTTITIAGHIPRKMHRFVASREFLLQPSEKTVMLKSSLGQPSGGVALNGGVLFNVYSEGNCSDGTNAVDTTTEAFDGQPKRYWRSHARWQVGTGVSNFDEQAGSEELFGERCSTHQRKPGQWRTDERYLQRQADERHSERTKQLPPSLSLRSASLALLTRRGKCLTPGTATAPTAANARVLTELGWGRSDGWYWHIFSWILRCSELHRDHLPPRRRPTLLREAISSRCRQTSPPLPCSLRTRPAFPPVRGPCSTTGVRPPSPSTRRAAAWGSTDSPNVSIPPYSMATVTSTNSSTSLWVSGSFFNPAANGTAALTCVANTTLPAPSTTAAAGVIVGCQLTTYNGVANTPVLVYAVNGPPTTPQRSRGITRLPTRRTLLRPC